MSKYQDYMDYFNQGTSQDGNISDFEKLEKRLFGNYVSPDIDIAMKNYKKKPNGAELFADYMLKHRPKGKIFFPPEPLNRPSEKKKGKYENINNVKNIIREMISKKK